MKSSVGGAVYAGLERKRDKAARRRNIAAGAAAGAGDAEMLDDSQDDDILESVIKSVTSPSSCRQTPRPDRPRRPRTSTRTSRNYHVTLSM